MMSALVATWFVCGGNQGEELFPGHFFECLNFGALVLVVTATDMCHRV